MSIDATQARVAVDLYESGLSSDAIGSLMGVHGSTIRRLLRVSGVKMRSISETRKKLPLRANAFDVLTPEALYWCGFFAADGSIFEYRNASPVIAIMLSRKDVGHIEKFRVFMGSGHAITPVANKGRGFGHGDFVKIAFRSRPIADRLNELGVKKGPLHGELTSSRDFWRGMIDGDGTLGVYGGKAVISLVGEKWLMSAFSRFAKRLDIGASLSVLPDHSIYRCATTRHSAGRVVTALYEDAPVSLERKQLIAEQIMHLPAGIRKREAG